MLFVKPSFFIAVRTFIAGPFKYSKIKGSPIRIFFMN
jgi:hypothetical protein